MNPLRVAFVLPGLHRVNRGAEVAFESIARHMARTPGFDVTLIGAGPHRPDEPYRFIHAGCLPRERFEHWPHLPVLRNDCVYEELTSLPSLWRAYRPSDYDATITCSYPFTNWFLRARRRGRRPVHVYVTQNGDWPPQRANAEYRWFGCEGLVCTNPEYFARQRTQWPCTLIPNGVEPDVFAPGPPDRAAFGLPEGVPIVLIASALIPSKRVREGIRRMVHFPQAHLVVAGDGPLRAEVDAMGAALLSGRFQRVSLRPPQMPALYRCADVLLHMSVIEPFGNVYLEALASGLPVVTHDRDLTRWMMGDLACLVDTDDDAAVAAALEQALARRRPEDVAARRDLVQRRFAWAEIARQYGEFVREVVAGRATVATAAPEPASTEPAAPDPRVGAVVIGRNEGERLRACLTSVRHQIANVIYVDSGSRDGSPALAESLGVPVIRLDASQPFTAARGRQTGLDALRRRHPELDFVQFIDGDCVLQPGWLTAAREVLQTQSEVVAVCGRRRETRTRESFYSRLIDIDWDIPPGEVPYFGGDALCRAAAIDAVGGWSGELIAGEEPDLSFRLRAAGGQVWRLAREATLHDVMMSRLGQFWRRAERSGFAYAEVGYRHRTGFGRQWAVRAVTTTAYGLILPLLAVVAAFTWWPLVLLPILLWVRLLWTLTRACRRKGASLSTALAYAALNIVGKTAGGLGAVRWTLRALTGRRPALIEYKVVSPTSASPATKSRETVGVTA